MHSGCVDTCFITAREQSSNKVTTCLPDHTRLNNPLQWVQTGLQVSCLAVSDSHLLSLSQLIMEVPSVICLPSPLLLCQPSPGFSIMSTRCNGSLV